MALQIVSVENNAEPEFKLIRHRTEIPNDTAEFALSMIASSALLAEVPDGETSSGNRKIRQMRPDELVTRAFDIAELAFKEMRARNMNVPVPPLEKYYSEDEVEDTWVAEIDIKE
jgi:hypothetical protein